MSVKECELNLDANQYELDLRGTPMFPCSGYFINIEQNINGEIPWHWHEEIEVLVVESGTIHFDLGGKDFTLNEGDGAFINSNILHSARIVGDEKCVLNSFVFHSSLISGAAESVFEQRYVRPLLNCCTLPGIPLLDKTKWQRQAVQDIREAYEVYKKEDFGCELFVRDKLSHVLYLIVYNMQNILRQQSKNETIDSVRIKEMLCFIHKYFADSLELSQIAEAANISERECLRCFQKTIAMPPMQYLLKYRVSVAARLLSDTNMPITEICSQSGFDSPSYFAKTFKRFMGYTPTAYRNCKESTSHTDYPITQLSVLP